MGRPDVPRPLVLQPLYWCGFSSLYPMTTQSLSSVPLQIQTQRIHHHETVGIQLRVHCVFCKRDGGKWAYLVHGTTNNWKNPLDVSIPTPKLPSHTMVWRGMALYCFQSSSYWSCRSPGFLPVNLTFLSLPQPALPTQLIYH